jgi:hypothetical protein
MEGFADIEGPLNIGLLWLLYLLGGLSVIALGVLFWVVRAKRRPGGTMASAEPVKSPLEIALDRLNHLRDSGETLDADPYTVEVSDIVRDYLESSLRIPAKEQTSEEFLLSLQQHAQLPDVLKDHMPDFLSQCDWVKFAKQNLEKPQRETLLKTAETVVDVTDSHLRAVREEPQPAPTVS